MRPPSTQALTAAQFSRLIALSERLLHAWVSTSDSSDAVAMKLAALAEFGLTALIQNSFGHRIDGQRLARAQRAVRYIYERTQLQLGATGTNRIRLCRGLKTREFVSGGIQSWTTDLSVAVRFDGYEVLEEQIPAGRVLAFHLGPLWPAGVFAEEAEYIVLAQR